MIKKYTILNYEQKREIIESLARDSSFVNYQRLSEKYNTSVKNLRRWVNAGILRKPGCGRKKMNIQAEQQLSQWVIEQSVQLGKRISRTRMKEHAIELFADPHFKASKAWQDQFIRDFDIKFKVYEALNKIGALNALQISKYIEGGQV